MPTELRLTLMSLLRRPGSTLVAVITLGLGIGANAAVFSLLAAALTRNAPGIAEPDCLVVLGRTGSGLGFDHFSYPDYCDYRDLSQSFSGLAAYADTAFSLSEGDRPEQLDGAVVTGNYFSVLGVAAAFGSVPGETVVVSHRLWQRRFGGRPSLVGERVRLNGRVFTVSAIAPEPFHGTALASALDVWTEIVPTSSSSRPDPWSDPRNRRDSFLVVVGRLKPGIRLGQAQSEVATIARQLELRYPDAYSDDRKKRSVTLDRRAAVDPLTRGIAVAVLSILMAAVALVLVIACANVTILLLVRTAQRTRETAVRLALGARPAHLVGQVLTESLLLSLAGGAIGLLLGAWIVKLLPVVMTDLGFLESRIDARAAAFTLVLSIITGCLSGLVPALQNARQTIGTALKSGDGGGYGIGPGFRNGLVVAEVGLSMIVLVGAGLLVRSVWNLGRVDKGFSSDHVLMMSIDPARIGYGADRRLVLYRDLFASLNEVPGLNAATLAGKSALSPDFPGLYVADGLEAQAGARFEARGDVIAPRYFEVLRIPLIAGRDFTMRDGRGAPGVAIVNETLARRQWPGQNPLGKRLRQAGLGIGPPLEVVGIARDARQARLEERPAPCVYLPLLQHNADHVRLHVRSTGDAGAVVATVRRVIHALDKSLPVFDIESLDEHIAREMALLWSATALVSAIGATALLLAAVGLYVVMSSVVARRTREIGLRMAVGASRGGVLLLILHQSMTLVLVGLAVGILGALAVTRVLQEVLYGLSASDPMTYGSASLLLTLVALAAAYVPARRAARADPMAALREE